MIVAAAVNPRLKNGLAAACATTDGSPARTWRNDSVHHSPPLFIARRSSCQSTIPAFTPPKNRRCAM